MRGWFSLLYYKKLICDLLNKNPTHPAFYENRDKTRNQYINVQLCGSKKWKDRLPGSQVTEGMHRECRTQFFEKAQCFYLATSLRVPSCYGKFVHAFVEMQLKSQQRQLGMTAVMKAGAYILL